MTYQPSRTLFVDDVCVSCRDFIEYHFCEHHDGPHCDAQWCDKETKND